jgi:hypothetical protein
MSRFQAKVLNGCLLIAHLRGGNLDQLAGKNTYT